MRISPIHVALFVIGVISPVGGYGFDGPDFAATGDPYMVRLSASAGPASRGNDGNTGTTASTNSNTVEGYWEVDLGSVKAIDSVRVLTPSTAMGVAVLRLFDNDHQSVFSTPLSSAGGGPNFDVALGDYYRVQYIRVGLEQKRRSPTIQITELEAYGAETNAVGLLQFNADTTSVSPGGAVTLSWAVESVLDVAIFPNVGDVSAQTAPDGTGSIIVNPTHSTEYRMVITHTTGVETKAVSVTVGGEPLPLRINEVVASNRWGLEDGYGDSSDWIELHNPSSQAVDLAVL